MELDTLAQFFKGGAVERLAWLIRVTTDERDVHEDGGYVRRGCFRGSTLRGSGSPRTRGNAFR